MSAGEPKEQVAVLGAGLMGIGIAQVLAAAGHQVRMYDPDPQALASVHERAAPVFEMLEQDPEGLARLQPTGDVGEALAGADLVIEAGPEDVEVKRGIFRQACSLVGPATVLATNTSSIAVGALADPLGKHARRFLATHFWHPPSLVPLVEVVPGAQTDPAVVSRTIGVLSDAGMHPVRLSVDVPGFVGNRLQHALKREAIALVAAGACDAETIDAVTRWGFGLRLPVLGPLEQSDLVGLDLTLAIHRQLMPTLDVTPHAHPLLEKKVAEGKLGMSTGEGFRTWTPQEAAAVRHRVTEHLVDLARRRAGRSSRAKGPGWSEPSEVAGDEGAAP